MASKFVVAILVLLVVSVMSRNSGFTHQHNNDEDIDLDVEDLHVAGNSHIVAKTCFPVTMQVCLPLGVSHNSTSVHLPSLFNSTTLFPGGGAQIQPAPNSDPCAALYQPYTTNPWVDCCDQYNWTPTSCQTSVGVGR